ncbi:hypothetical protein [Streptomyces sp. 4F14]|uniref:hypothetical protein n=1 Tax=Streptomyces sp. 4F14 TaxID=3394380 RepID=UPI003A83D273
MAAARDADGRLDRRGSGWPAAVVDSAWLCEPCLVAGGDDDAVSLGHPDLVGERPYVRAALPGTRTLIAVADKEFRQTDARADHAARTVTRALNPSDTA